MRLTLMAITLGFSLVVGLQFAAMAGPLPDGTPDTDGDGVEDEFDNCIGPAGPTTTNADQCDGNHDGCGNTCSVCDPNGNGAVDIFDVNGAVGNFGGSVSEAGTGADCNCNGAIDIFDVNGLVGSFGATANAGPSGLPSELLDGLCTN